MYVCDVSVASEALAYVHPRKRYHEHKYMKYI